MRIKEILISSGLVVLCVCLIFCTFTLEKTFEPPATKLIEVNFENGFVNNASEDISLVAFGDIALENKSIVGKGVKLNNGHFMLNGSEKVKLRNGFTFSVWFNISDTTPTEPILFSRESSTGDVANGPVSIYFSEDYTIFRTDITMKLANSEYGSYSFASKKLFDSDTIRNEWHNLTAVFDGNIFYYYFDGVLSSAEILPVEFFDYVTIANNNKIFSIGKGAWGNLLGMVDEVHFYDYAVSKEQAIKFYTNGVEKFKNKFVMRLGSETAEINGNVVEAIPLIEENETIMISAQYIVDKMGGKLIFDETDGYGRADITMGNDKISIWVMDTNAIINDKFSKLNIYPVIRNEIVYVPVRFVAEGLGAMVSWNEELGQVTIYCK